MSKIRNKKNCFSETAIHFFSIGCILSESVAWQQIFLKKNGRKSHVAVHLLFYRLNLPVDFILTVLPLQLFMSVLSDFSTQCLLTLIILAAVLVYLCSTQRPQREPLRAADVFKIPMGNQRPFITYYRACVNLFTAFSILAVDFKLFPRHFAKAETYGTGLMDVGVAGFLVSNAIVSPEAKGKITTDR